VEWQFVSSHPEISQYLLCIADDAKSLLCLPRVICELTSRDQLPLTMFVIGVSLTTWKVWNACLATYSGNMVILTKTG